MVIRVFLSDGLVDTIAGKSPHANNRSTADKKPSYPEEESPVMEAYDKPFFIMDYLVQVDSGDLALAQKMLQEQRNKKQKRMPKKAVSEPNLQVPANKTKRISQRKLSEMTTPFRTRSIMAGNSWNTRGVAQAKAGAWEKALACWENALEIRTQIYGDTHLDVANTVNNIGIAQGKLNRVDQAIDSLSRALAIRVEHFGREHQEVATTLHNLGNVFLQANDLESAVKCFCESKKLHEKLLGPHHIQVARACVAMGNTYNQVHQLKDAREAYMDAVAIFERAGLPATNVEVQNTLKDIQEINRRLRTA